MFNRWKYGIAFILTWVLTAFISWAFLKNSYVYSNPTYDPSFSRFKHEILVGLCKSYGEGRLVIIKENRCHIQLKKEFEFGLNKCQGKECGRDSLSSYAIELGDVTSDGIKIKIYHFISLFENKLKGFGSSGGDGDLFDMPFKEFRPGMDRFTLNLVKPDSLLVFMDQDVRSKNISLTHLFLNVGIIDKQKINFSPKSHWFQFLPDFKIPTFLGSLENYAKGIPLEEPSFWKMLYFSGVTILTIGYGDVVPLSWPARALCILEGLMGVFFMGMFVAHEYEYQNRSRRMSP